MHEVFSYDSTRGYMHMQRLTLTLNFSVGKLATTTCAKRFVYFVDAVLLTTFKIVQ